jgi:tetratricopeptide (TPR) repeat protein
MSFRLFQRTTAGPAKHWLVIAGAIILAGLAPWGYRHASIAWRVRAARAALAAGDAPRAIAELRKAERIAPDQPVVSFLLGRALRRAGELQEVDAYLDRALRAGWSEEQVRQQHYLALLQTGHIKEADSYFSGILRAGAGDELAEEIYEARTKGFLSSYRLTDALLCIDYWLQWRPHTRQARMWRADIWERIDRWQNAAEEYGAVVAHDPSDQGVRIVPCCPPGRSGRAAWNGAVPPPVGRPYRR